MLKANYLAELPKISQANIILGGNPCLGLTQVNRVNGAIDLRMLIQSSSLAHLDGSLNLKYLSLRKGSRTLAARKHGLNE